MDKWSKIIVTHPLRVTGIDLAKGEEKIAHKIAAVPACMVGWI